MEFLEDFHQRNVKRSFYKNRIFALDLTIKCWSGRPVVTRVDVEKMPGLRCADLMGALPTTNG